MEGNLRLKINWASLTVEGKFTVFALFYFVFEGNVPSTSPRGAYIWRGDLTGVFCIAGLYMERLIFGILRYVHNSHNGTETETPNLALGICEFHQSYFWTN